MNFKRLLIFAFLAFSVCAVSAAPSIAEEIVITAGGDTGFARNGVSPRRAGALTSSGATLTWERMTAGIRGLPNGDLNFLNLETVVTPRADLTYVPKGYNFRSHPHAIDHLIGLGFNLFSNANNHSYDYGFEGYRETIRNMAAEKENFPQIIYSGLGNDAEEAARAQIVEKRGEKFAFVAAGFLETDIYRPNSKHPGQLNVRDDSDFDLQLSSLGKANANFRILSVHDGIEGVVIPSERERKRYEYAVEKRGVNLVIGHHPHVPRPLERIGDGLIIHSLGNFLLLGAANLNDAAVEKSFGLFARVYLNGETAGGDPKLQAVEVVPLTNMQEAPRPMNALEAKRRILALNRLAAKIGPNGLQLKIRESDGAGYACLGANPGPRAAAFCR